MNKQQEQKIKTMLDEKLKEAHVNGITIGVEVVCDTILNWIEQGKTIEEIKVLTKGAKCGKMKEMISKGAKKNV